MAGGYPPGAQLPTVVCKCTSVALHMQVCSGATWVHLQATVGGCAQGEYPPERGPLCILHCVVRFRAPFFQVGIPR